MVEKNNAKVRPGENQERLKQSVKDYEVINHKLEELGGYWIGLRESGMPGKQRISVAMPMAFSELTKTQIKFVEEAKESPLSVGSFDFEIPQKVESVLGKGYGIFAWRSAIISEAAQPAVLSAMRRITANLLEGMNIGKNVNKELLIKDICGTLEEVKR